MRSPYCKTWHGTTPTPRRAIAHALIPAVLVAFTWPAHAQDAASASRGRPFEITDNSFLVEEAFNQEPGIFQNIATLRATDSAEWELAFTQEWPLFTESHQFSYTVGFGTTDGEPAFGDTYLHYRFQALTEHGRVPAFSPRLSIILPTGQADAQRGNSRVGWEANLPFSKQFGDLFVHANAGFTHVPADPADVHAFDVLTPRAAFSGIWRARPMLNAMLEALIERERRSARSRATVVTVAPGLRTGWNIGTAQTIVGLALPIQFADSQATFSVFGYVSHELPFTNP